MGEPGLDAEKMLQLMQVILRWAAYFLGGFGLLGLSTYGVFLGLQIFASPRRTKVRIAKAAQTATIAPDVGEKRNLIPVEMLHPSDKPTANGTEALMRAEAERFPGVAAGKVGEDAINKRKGAGTLRFGKVIEILIWVAGLGVLAENIFLLRQNRSLQETLAPQIAAGAHFEKPAGLTLDGRFQLLALPPAESKLLIITFSPGCPACQANQEGWMKLAGALEQKGVRVLWLSRDPVEVTKDYCLKHGIRLSDVLADPPYRTYLQLGLARVPNTLLVRADGTVEQVWAGRVDQAGWNSVFAYFGEREETASPLQSQVGANQLGCGSELSQTSVKSCK